MEQIDQLNSVDFQQFGLEPIEAASARDPLNPDVWWERINSDSAVENLNELSKGVTDWILPTLEQLLFSLEELSEFVILGMLIYLSS